MLRPELYHKTVDILVQAYFNDTLVHGDWCGCAVGNLISANLGISAIKSKSVYGLCIDWEKNNYELDGSEWYKDRGNTRTNKAILSIHSTGYSGEEVWQIEKHFEKGQYSASSEDEAMFNSLMMVIEALDKIHQNTNEETTQSAKQKFNKQLTPQS